MARKAYDTGVSICRPLYYEWPEENKAYSVEDEYLFGDDILVSPISTPADSEGKSERKTWLPDGVWFDMCRNKLRIGGQTITDRYALNEIPYFIRLGSIIPCNPELSHLKAEPSSLVLWVMPGADGEGKLYEDQGDSEAYKDGEFAWTDFRQSHSAEGTTLTISARQGSYEGMPTERAWQVVFFLMGEPADIRINGEETSDWTYDEASGRLTVNVPARSCSENITLNVKEMETDIREIQEDPLTSIRGNIYDLSGRQMVSGKLPFGIYIRNGKKILIPYKP